MIFIGHNIQAKTPAARVTTPLGSSVKVWVRNRSLAPRTAFGILRRRRISQQKSALFQKCNVDSAVAASETDNDQSETIYEKTFDLQDGSVAIKITTNANETVQHVTLSADLPGRLLLHWGVEGGKGYKGGWRLPKESCRPDGTIEYKKRALQSPLDHNTIRLTLKDEEASDYLNFVIKDIATNKWYDFNGGNFQVPLRSTLQPSLAGSSSSATALRHENYALSSSDSDSDSYPNFPPLVRISEIPIIPQDLSSVWSYMKWEADGCPARSQEESDAEYQRSVRELATLLRRGVSLDELRRVAAEGVQRYSTFMAEQTAAANKAMRSQPPSQPSPLQDTIVIPDELVNLKAYLLWEQSGKPEGADFGAQARQQMSVQLSQGKTLQQIEYELRNPGVEPTHQPVSRDVYSNVETPPPVDTPAGSEQDPKEEQNESVVVVGQSTGMTYRNPLDLIHRSTPPRLAEKQRQREKPLDPLVALAQEDEIRVWHRVYPLGSKAQLLVAVKQRDPTDPNSAVDVVFTTDAAADVVLHWGVKKSGRKGSSSSSEWCKPSESLLPPHSELIKDGIAAETAFRSCDEEECLVEIGGSIVPLQRLEISLPSGHGLSALTFVIRSEDGTRWWNDGGSNFTIPVPGPKEERSREFVQDELSRIIIDCEVNSGAWTLMHRFNKAAELIQGILDGNFGSPDDAMPKIFVWLRYSAIRQLTWQRNYNTQPRILGAAQERLTHTIADAYNRLRGPAQEWARLCLTTVGRGGNAQAVRDEILNIMHRNKISEVKGTWMEEFHQKLHNNTTPDDVPICEAYLAFLRSDGDLNAYRRTLSEAGISKQRLESFDRPILTDPVFFPEKKAALINDFSKYLNILKATHSGADLQASASAAAKYVPSSAKSYLGYVLSHSNDSSILPLMEAAVEARTELALALSSNRELIYLDLALENAVRAAAERGAAAAGTAAAAFVTPLLQNLVLSVADNEEVCYCLKAWLELPKNVRQGNIPSKDDALRAIAVVDRLRRALGQISDRVTAAIGQISGSYGNAFGCEPWCIELFPEEVVRGGPAFAVSLVLSSIEPSLRTVADMGAWQVISPAPSALGRLIVVPSLSGIQDNIYDEPTILLARRVTGEEEVPVGVIGVLSGDAPDVLSHLSVRTRNLKVLFAACYDTDELDTVAGLEGEIIQLGTTAAGGVTWEAIQDSSSSSSYSSSSDLSSLEQIGTTPIHHHHHKKLSMTIPAWSQKWAVQMDEYADGLVGAKSRNLAGLRGKLPDWISLPASVTMPFGCFEEVLKEKENLVLAQKLADVVQSVNHSNCTEKLAACRSLASQIVIPKVAEEELRTAMTKAGVSVPERDSPQWVASVTALTTVWASKFNDRAYISTRKVGINFNDVRMAVLVQRVVPALYAFVIHTVNPTTGDEGEIYCELVRGLGEAIVSGTVPGTALAFSARKDDLDNPKMLLYPSKSEGMFVEDGSLIFRSDSNGEDLEGYAGAGLYDSVTTAQTVRQVVDYSSDPIVADPEFRRQLLAKICRVGAEIETALGNAQDVEGVVDPQLNIFVVQTRPQM